MLYKTFLKNLNRCPFCEPKDRIIKENKRAYLTYAIAPYHKHHLLVIPKKHDHAILDIRKNEMADITALIRYGLSLLHKLGYHNCSVLAREGKIGKIKSIEHMHYHVVPAVALGDLDHYGKQRKVITRREINKILSDFKKAYGLRKMPEKHWKKN